jgi:hypothetical protein
VDVSTRIAFVSAALVVIAAAGAYSQPVGPNVSPPAFIPTPVAVPTPPPPPPPSVDQLLDALERVQAQKAALEKQEQELKAAIRKKLEAQAERLKKLGVAAPAAKEPEPDRVGRIIIEGNTKTRDQKILDKLDFRPGQVLHYPALDVARARLEKAGFRGVVVEVVPNEFDSTFKDIRVKVEESKPEPVVPTVRG